MAAASIEGVPAHESTDDPASSPGTAAVGRSHRPELSDALLIEQCRNGSRSAFPMIVRRYERPLLRHCGRIVDSAAAQDAVQETFLCAWSAIRTGAEVRALRPWLFTVAHRTAIATLKDRNRCSAELPDTISAGRSVPDDVDRAVRLRTTFAALAGLPADQRDALIASAVHGASGRQIARQLGVDESGVRQLVFRARAALRVGGAAVCLPPLAVMRALRPLAGSLRRPAQLARGACAPGQAESAGRLLKAGAIALVGATAAGAGAFHLLASATAPSRHHPAALVRTAPSERRLSGFTPDGPATTGGARVTAAPLARGGKPAGGVPRSRRLQVRIVTPVLRTAGGAPGEAAAQSDRALGGGAHASNRSPAEAATVSAGASAGVAGTVSGVILGATGGRPLPTGGAPGLVPDTRPVQILQHVVSAFESVTTPTVQAVRSAGRSTVRHVVEPVRQIAETAPSALTESALATAGTVVSSAAAQADQASGAAGSASSVTQPVLATAETAVSSAAAQAQPLAGPSLGGATQSAQALGSAVVSTTTATAPLLGSPPVGVTGPGGAGGR